MTAQPFNDRINDFGSAQRTLARIETVNIIRKNQIINSKGTDFRTFYSIAVSYLILFDFLFRFGLMRQNLIYSIEKLSIKIND